MNGACGRLRVFGASHAALWGPLVLYLVLVTIASVRLADQINPDGVSYLRNARLLADGRFWDSVSGYWSPLLSWLFAPLLRFGIDSLVGARVVLALCGATLLITSWQLMNRLAILPVSWHAAIMTVIAINAVPWTFLITPDVLLAACLFAYGVASLAPELAVRPARAWRCGVFAGVAFLAKAYALPFFLVHFPLSLALSWWVTRRTDAPARPPSNGRALAASAACGLLGFVMIAGPWMAILSVKYGRATATASAAFNHAVVNPAHEDRPAFEDRMIAPMPGKVSIWETPEALQYQDWSPFSSLANAAAQGRVIRDGLFVFTRSVDALELTIVLIVVSPVLAVRYRHDPPELRRLLWGVGTIVIYCGGCLLVFCERRYFMPVVVPIGLFLCATYAKAGLDALRTWAPRYHRPARALAVFVLVSSFGYRGPRDGVPMFRAGVPPSYRQLGQQLRESGAAGPIVSDRWASGLYVAYHAGLPYLGTVAAPDRLPSRADDFGAARVFVRWSGGDLPDERLLASGWRPLMSARNDVAARDRAVVWIRTPHDK
jgi:hypothetical protein